MYSRGLYSNSNYPYYHELQLPMINNYYFNKSPTPAAAAAAVPMGKSNANLVIREVKVIRPKSVHQSIVADEQIDLNAVYKISNRRKRTSYNTNFLNMDQHLANLNSSSVTTIKPLVDTNNNQQEQQDENFTSTSLYNNRRQSFFTQKTANNTQHLSDRKSFWRPKTPCISLDMRRKDSRNLLDDQKLSTVSKFENISKRTDNLIEKFRTKYENKS